MAAQIVDNQIRDTSVTSTAQVNVVGRPCAVKTIWLDNSANSGVNHLKLYNLATPPVVGTTAPNNIFPTNPNTVFGGHEMISFDPPLEFSNGLSYSCVQEAGTAGVTNPSSAVDLTVEFI